MSLELDIRPEESLLLTLCRLNFPKELTDRIKASVSTGSDWNYFGSLANQHGVDALVYHNLKKLELLNSVPESIMSVLRSAFITSLSRNAYNFEAMNQVLQLLNTENIKTVLLKGLALELLVYGNTGLRQMTDVDILISREMANTGRIGGMGAGVLMISARSI